MRHSILTLPLFLLGLMLLAYGSVWTAKTFLMPDMGAAEFLSILLGVPFGVLLLCALLLRSILKVETPIPSAESQDDVNTLAQSTARSTESRTTEITKHGNLSLANLMRDPKTAEAIVLLRMDHARRQAR